MNPKEFFLNINQIYESISGNLQNEDQNQIIKQTFQNFISVNKNKFKILNEQNFAENEENYLNQNGTFVEIEGFVADIFEPQLSVTQIKHQNKTIFCLFNKFLNEDESNFDSDNDQQVLQDLQIFLVLLDNKKTNFSSFLWNELNDSYGQKLMESKQIPLIVINFLNIELKLGSRIVLKGYLNKENFNQQIQEADGKLFQDYYNEKVVYRLYLLESSNIINQFSLTINENSQKNLILFEKFLENQFQDELTAKLLMISFFTNNNLKINEDPINLLTMNFYGMQKEDIENLSSIYKMLQQNHTIIKIDQNSLNQQIFAEKDNESDLMIMNNVFAGSNDIFILDETDLQVGELKELATKNILRIKEIIEFQHLSIFFNSNQLFKFDFSNKILSFSKGRSLFGFNLKFSRKKQEKNFEVIQLDENILSDLIRSFETLKILVNQIDFKEDDQSIIEQAFVEIRQVDKNFTQEDFKTILKLSKHLSVLQNKKQIEKENFFEGLFIFKQLQEREQQNLKNLKN